MEMYGDVPVVVVVKDYEGVDHELVVWQMGEIWKRQFVGGTHKMGGNTYGNGYLGW